MNDVRHFETIWIPMGDGTRLAGRLWLPIAGAILVMLIGSKPQGGGLARWIALGVSVLAFVASVPLAMNFQPGTAEMQFVERIPWVERLGEFYHIGVDGI